MKIYRTSFIFIFLLFSFISLAQKAPYEKYQKYCYLLKTDKGTFQTAIKIKEFDGFITTLHGFLNSSNDIDYLFGDGMIQFLQKEDEYLFSDDYDIRLNAIDLKNDLALIEFAGEKKKFDKEEGIAMGQPNLPDGAEIILLGHPHGNESTSTRPNQYFHKRQKLKKLFRTLPKEEYDYYDLRRSPDLESEIIWFTGDINKGDSGAALIDGNNSVLIAIVGGSYERSGWAVIPRIDNFKTKEQLSDSEKRQIKKIKKLYMEHKSQFVSLPLKNCVSHRSVLYFSQDDAKKLNPIDAIAQAYLLYRDSLIESGNSLCQNYAPLTVVKNLFERGDLRPYNRHRNTLSHNYLKSLWNYARYLSDREETAFEDALLSAKKLFFMYDTLRPLPMAEERAWESKGLDFYKLTRELFEDLRPHYVCDSLFDNANQKYREENYKEAYRLYSDVLRAGCFNYEAALAKKADIKALSDTWKVQADSCYRNRKFDCAIEYYSNRLSIYPFDLEANDRIQEMDSLFNFYTSEGEKYFDRAQKGKHKDYPIAKKYFDKALLYEPDNQYILTRISDINYILRKIKKDKKFRAAMSAGNRCMLLEDYLCALDNFRKAHIIKPEHPEPPQKIAEADSLLKIKHHREKNRDIAGILEESMRTKLLHYSCIQKLPNIKIEVPEIKNINCPVLLEVTYGMDLPLNADSSNYLMNMKYENFPSGRYHYSGSRQALDIINWSLNDFFKDYNHLLFPDSTRIIIIGVADGVPYRGRLKYNREYGNIMREIVKENPFSEGIQFRKCRRVEPNLGLAFLRAFDAKKELEKYNHSFLKYVPIKAYAQEDNRIGGRYRRVEMKIFIHINNDTSIHYFPKEEK